VSNDPLLGAATTLGTQHGSQFAIILYVSHIDFDTAIDILYGYRHHDDLVMNLCPEPLSGEYEDEPSPMFILGQIAKLNGGDPITNGDKDYVLLTYENAYKEAFWSNLLGKLKEALNGQTH
jgi:hypothetical protein